MHPRRVGTMCLIATVMCLPLQAAAQPPATEAVEQQLRDDWQVVYFQQKRIGYVHVEIVKWDSEHGARYVSTVHQELTLGRADQTVRLATDQRIVEDAGGRLVSFTYKLDQGPVVHTTRGEVKDGKLVITMGEGPNARTQTAEVPRGLCPWAVEQVARAKGYEPGTTYALPIFRADAPTQPTTVRVSIGEKEPQQVYEITKWLRRVESELSVLPGSPIIAWVDDEGQAWITRMKLGFIQMELRRVSKEMALQPPEEGELLLASAIAPDRPIPNARNLEKLTLLLRPVDPSGPELTLPSDAYQQVERRQTALLVSVRRAHGSPKKSYRLPYAGQEHAEFLRPTSWLETEDPLIIQMSREAVGEETDALKAAHRIMARVQHVVEEKTLGMGFATALETARQKAGDCTEHATLAAALARAAGIPSRVVLGLAYGGATPGDTQPRFYYHMWTEVYVGEWLPLDAALGSHDATHVAIVRSALEGPDVLFDLSATILRFMGNTRIEVLDLEH